MAQDDLRNDAEALVHASSGASRSNPRLSCTQTRTTTSGTTPRRWCTRRSDGPRDDN